MSVEEDVAALLDQVEAYRQGECAKLLKEANHQAEAQLRAAHREARQRVHQVLAELRRDARGHIVAAEARAQARERSREHRATLALLEAGWTRLGEELARRWQDPATRATWVEILVERALASLPAARWLIRYPADWPESEREKLAQTLAERLPQPPEWSPDAGIPAGLHICAGGASPQGDSDPLRAEARAESYACVDGTLEGLLADRAAVEAALLAAVEEGQH